MKGRAKGRIEKQERKNSRNLRKKKSRVLSRSPSDANAEQLDTLSRQSSSDWALVATRSVNKNDCSVHGDGRRRHFSLMVSKMHQGNAERPTMAALSDWAGLLAVWLCFHLLLNNGFS